MAAKIVNNIDTLVLIGKWNIFIFSPDWVKENIFDNTNFTIDFVVPNGAITFKSDEIAFIVSSESIRFKALKNNGSIFKKLILVLRTIIRLLSQTPVTAFGINFKYDMGDDGSDYFKDLPVVSDINAISQQTIKWTIEELSSKSVLNLSITKNREQTSVDFNYHYPISNCTELASIIEDDSLICLKQEDSATKLRDIFNFQIEQL